MSQTVAGELIKLLTDGSIKWLGFTFSKTAIVIAQLTDSEASDKTPHKLDLKYEWWCDNCYAIVKKADPASLESNCAICGKPITMVRIKLKEASDAD